jgi:hypothetical protein
MFDAVEATDDDRDWWLPVQRQARRWAHLLQDDERKFRAEAQKLIERNRTAFGLPASHPALP